MDAQQKYETAKAGEACAGFGEPDPATPLREFHHCGIGRWCIEQRVPVTGVTKLEAAAEAAVNSDTLLAGERRVSPKL